MHVQQDIEIAPHTTMRVGGPARFFARARSAPQLIEHISFAHARNAPMFVLGGGSNIVVSDAGWNGLVIRNEIPGVQYENGLIIAGAGVSWDILVSETVQKGLRGLENLSAIPGTAGAAPIQNIGAYGVEVKERIAWVEAVNARTLRTHRFTAEECGFQYRWSIFKEPKNKEWIITRVSFRLSADTALRTDYTDVAEHLKAHSISRPDAIAVRSAVVAIRNRKFPDLNTCGTAGSFFKNPVISSGRYKQLKTTHPGIPGYSVASNVNGQMSHVKIPLAWVLDRVCGLRGIRKGNVGLYEKQPLVLINYSGATAKEINVFADEIARIVFEKTNIRIEREVEYVTRANLHE